MEKEKCVICGNETEYYLTTPIDFRENYIEGAGQVCPSCANRVNNSNTRVVRSVVVSEEKVKELSNNFDLGQYVRKLFDKKT